MHPALTPSHACSRVAALLSPESPPSAPDSFPLSEESEPVRPDRVSSGLDDVVIVVAVEAVLESTLEVVASSVISSNPSDVVDAALETAVEDMASILASSPPPQDPSRRLRSEELLMLDTSLPQFLYCAMKTVSDSRSNTTTEVSPLRNPDQIWNIPYAERRNVSPRSVNSSLGVIPR